MIVPDHIFALGGAGKEIAFTFLESDWVLEEILKPSSDSKSVKVTIIDSAENEYPGDEERICRIRTNISEMKEKLRESNTEMAGTIEIEYKLLTENIQLNNKVDLLGKDVVKQIANANGLKEDNWWLRSQHINENLDFAHGVVRKRGLGKAIYYKANAQDSEMRSVVDLPTKGRVAIFAGLGGGTGSGILIDIAAQLKKIQATAEITLFGVLPSPDEGIQENTNALAALSELEYLNLLKENPFKDIILLPIEPTNFGGKTGNRVGSEPWLKEFDEAVSYALAAYYNTQRIEDPFADSPEFAPFTIAIPQILRYSVEEITTARDEISNLLELKEQIDSVEKIIYDEVTQFIESQNIRSGNLQEPDRTDLRGRIETIESLLDLDLFNRLGYYSQNQFSNLIEDAKSEEDSGIEKTIQLIDASLKTIGTTSEDLYRFVDDIDELLAEVLASDLRNITTRYEILQKKNSIRNDEVRSAIEFLLAMDSVENNIGIIFSTIESSLQELHEEHDELESEYEEITEQIEQRQEEIDRKVENTIHDWRDDVESDLQRLELVQDHPIQTRLSSLQGELERIHAAVEDAETVEGVKNTSIQGINDILKTIEDELEELGINFRKERKRIEDSISLLQQSKTTWLKIHKNYNLIHRLLGSANRSADDLYELQHRINQLGVFQITASNEGFDSELTYDVSSISGELERAKQEIRNSAIEAAQEHLPNDLQVENKLRSVLNEGGGLVALEEVLEESIREQEHEIDEMEQRRDQISRNIDELRSEIELYSDTLSLLERTGEFRESFVDQVNEFRDLYQGYEEINFTNRSAGNEYAYINKIQPNDLFRAAGSKDILESNLLASSTEMELLYNHLNKLAQNARDPKYTGLQRRRLYSDKISYRDMGIRLSILSRASDQLDPDLVDFEDVFSESFDLETTENRLKNPYTAWQRDIGGPWDIGFVVFIDGVFLDNIRMVTQEGGYYDGYTRQAERIGEDIYIHHSHGLEQNKLIIRKKFIDVDDESDLGFYLSQSEKEISERIVNELIDVEMIRKTTDESESHSEQN